MVIDDAAVGLVSSPVFEIVRSFERFGEILLPLGLRLFVAGGTFINEPRGACGGRFIF